MADERPAQDAAAAPSEPVVIKKRKKKKKMSKLTIFFWLLLLALGTGVGMHLSGIWDGRPLFWSIVPNIPYVGKQLAEFFQVPEFYALTVAERRAVELEQWQRRLDERERHLQEGDVDRLANLDNREIELLTLSRDVDYRIRRLRRLEANANAANANDAPSQAELDLMNQVARTYQDMSARNAAKIVEQLRDNLAVELLKKLPNDARASILGKVKATKAARLTELMATPQQ
ncbi:MAG: hypothetical protein IJT58_08465 [Synergistaceae bacterium]|nr:hypothetical protein [Synergistaceae bacterium]